MDILAARKRAAELAQAKAAQAKAAPDSGQPKDKEPEEPPAPERMSEAFPPVPPVALPELEETALPEAIPPPEEVVAERAGDANDEQRDVPEQPEEGGEAEEEQELEMLAFRLGAEEYALPVELVGEVLTLREITPVPHVPSYVPGVCSLRGTILPIIDLKQRLGLGSAERDEKSRIIVVALGPDDRIGVLVERVRGVVRVLPSSVQPAPDTVAQGEGAAFLRGIARKDERLYILLDMEKVAATGYTEKSR